MIVDRSMIGGVPVESSGARRFRARDPRTGSELEPAFEVATRENVDAALAQACRAAPSLADPQQRARFLEAVAVGLERDAGPVIERAGLESALPEARLRSELARTVGQLRLFAGIAREGSWVDARIDRGDPSRSPAPRPDLRSMLMPIGPVAVFGASNFPLAFSTLGGDTASAWAAGNPVIVKGHPAHPGTAALCAAVAFEAARTSGVDPGVLALLVDDGHEVGAQLVTHPELAAVGFTGSQRGGLALARIAAARPVPIPVFAEMGSVNPVVVLDGALGERAQAIADGLVASCGLGVGQFCTNPGLVLVIGGDEADAFVDLLAARFRKAAGGVMLTPGLALAYDEGSERLRHLGAQLLAEGTAVDGVAAVAPRLWGVHGDTVRARPALVDEVFGPSTVVVRLRDADDLLALIERLPGQLSGTVHAGVGDDALAQQVAAGLRRKVGRVIANAFPTGVEVGHAMVHGGPYPATTDPRSTSVGGRAISRFARLVAWQDAPAQWLPAELHDHNPRGIWRLVDGSWTRASLTV